MHSVNLVEYRNSWPSQFNEAAVQLALIFAGIPVHIEHIGSTSIPALCAKPVLDILLGVHDLASIESRASGLHVWLLARAWLEHRQWNFSATTFHVESAH
ncbi:hypothetical protein ELE36_03710 [Pseudolysobacter antarcticus]|uniref:GrpB family protein n=1 Tax=Pseudolysobacter antarcticus TaxID=2511995 RepID=A0A411HGI6_9GAMM|nr:GrpB family protein [Pseudolysobacter antarcticus]QBB69557.1 hypothetical protein ELE36_03710 [Pseudolysobacter antarcticus]